VYSVAFEYVCLLLNILIKRRDKWLCDGELRRRERLSEVVAIVTRKDYLVGVPSVSIMKPLRTVLWSHSN
jgi:hypothetical protein